MASSASSSSRQHSNDASSRASSSSTKISNDVSSCGSSSSRQHSNDASSCKRIELWCDHCAWLVKGQRFDDGKVCCAFCGKILQDTTVTNNARGQRRARGTGSCVNVASRKASSSRALQSAHSSADEFEKG
ncbi:hypothetical protein POM88_042598 [Heracleum sosnowskyi]|uniref:Uncharacterized protein n=1 Tax=Heracleum sosnowskyi TaxID=360622 RepID=A0AAD8MBT9_9APIA|nr:hypothetical protein POM88_042598 [Heracleum sosnowskyi]